MPASEGLTPAERETAADKRGRPKRAIRTDRAIRAQSVETLCSRNISIASGRAANFEFKTDVIAAHKQMKAAGLAVYQVLLGGDGGEFIVATLAHDLAELDKGPANVTETVDGRG
jgi:hypothetical protein